MLKEGDDAPDFELAAGDGSTVSLKGLRGKKVILYFYPRDDTPGCTTEACSFRDNSDQYTSRGAAVFGISADNARSHQKFTSKYGLNFPLLSDPDHAVARAYSSYGPKKFMGREYEGILRNTFLVDEEGKIARVWESVKPLGHAEEVLAAL
ncbi:MAG: thioredoxin-dependent peroxiredoxin [Chloroflexota bacterium]|nr:thioredoxin-dependent peroxiredoxin [Chloroflexota bacterium]